ncbi:hypothetical protein CPB97_006592 [Podila verticillata]|nr:hypothetical protein CPB97_006592 [Podila verticillata]
MTTAPPDPVFDELTTIPGHVASFSADLATGQLLNVKGDIHQNQATTIQKLMQDVGQLVSRYAHGAPMSLSGDDSDDSLVRKVTIMTEDSTLALTMADNKIYGVEKQE